MQSPAFSCLTVVLNTVTAIAFVFDVEFYDAGAHSYLFHTSLDIVICKGFVTCIINQNTD